MALRFAITTFALANPFLKAATINFFTVDGSGDKTATLATLYDAVTGTGTLTNPQVLDSDGKFPVPVYIEQAVIANITDTTAGDHDTGIIHTPGSWKGNWATATVYYAGEYVQASTAADGSENIYVVDETHTSGTFATDVTAGKLAIAIDVSTMQGHRFEAELSALLAATFADQTDVDAAATAADLVLTNADVVSTGDDVTSTNADVISTGDDVNSTNADAISTDADATAAAVSAAAAQAVADGLRWKTQVLCKTTANITLSGEQTLDGIATSTSRVLAGSQSSPEENGIYVSAAGAWARASDMDTWAEVPGVAVVVEQGSTLADTLWLCTSDTGGTLETTAIVWSQFGAGGIVNVVDDVTPQYGGFMDTNSFFHSFSQGAAIASVAGDTDIWANFDGNAVHITGTEAITDFGTPKQAGDSMWVIFDAAASVVDSATITVDGNANFQAAANDLALVYALTTSTFLFKPFPNSGALFTDVDRTLTAGFAGTDDAEGTFTSGTYTPTHVGGNWKTIVHGAGGFAIGVPAGTKSVISALVNSSASGSVTTVGYDAVTGDTIDNTGTNQWMLYHNRVGGMNHLNIVADAGNA